MEKAVSNRIYVVEFFSEEHKKKRYKPLNLGQHVFYGIFTFFACFYFLDRLKGLDLTDMNNSHLYNDLLELSENLAVQVLKKKTGKSYLAALFRQIKRRMAELFCQMKCSVVESFLQIKHSVVEHISKMKCCIVEQFCQIKLGILWNSCRSPV